MNFDVILKMLGIIAIITMIGFVFVTCDNVSTATSNPCGKGHSYPAWIAPTCIETGNSQRVCTRSGCGNVETRSTVIAALGHTGLTAATAATCIAYGNTGSGTCTRCSETVIGEMIYSLGHDWQWETYTNGIRDCQRVGCSVAVGIGDRGPAGGIIFYVNPAGFRVGGDMGIPLYTAYYLEAATVNQGSMAWASSDYATTNVNEQNFVGTSIGAGRGNTAYILTRDPYAPAAKACVNYRLGGKSDWFLPSKDELNEMYKQRSYLYISSGSFWYSTQVYYNLAGVQNFESGSQGSGGKSKDFNVRAVRAF